MILLGALLLANCSGDFEQETGIVPSHSGQVSFLFDELIKEAEKMHIWRRSNKY